eukprot:TRINITY_DN106916_c0_g1_i1.p1 TRINITY_DN106916_c0_g1~~TRINITY_DN106916_c0_g1_i1.p1  ORF type:complete len:716 (-),score=135.10 TRINITY_DN106916_c0_g1_i1:38-2185(-)
MAGPSTLLAHSLFSTYNPAPPSGHKKKDPRHGRGSGKGVLAPREADLPRRLRLAARAFAPLQTLQPVLESSAPTPKPIPATPMTAAATRAAAARKVPCRGLVFAGSSEREAAPLVAVLMADSLQAEDAVWSPSKPQGSEASEASMTEQPSPEHTSLEHSPEVESLHLDEQGSPALQKLYAALEESSALEESMEGPRPEVEQVPASKADDQAVATETVLTETATVDLQRDQACLGEKRGFTGRLHRTTTRDVMARYRLDEVADEFEEELVFAATGGTSSSAPQRRRPNSAISAGTGAVVHTQRPSSSRAIRPTYVAPSPCPFTDAPRGQPERPPALPQWPCRKTNPAVLPRATRISGELKPPSQEQRVEVGIRPVRRGRSGVRFHAGGKRRQMATPAPALEVNEDGTLDFRIVKQMEAVLERTSPSPELSEFRLCAQEDSTIWSPPSPPQPEEITNALQGNPVTRAPPRMHLLRMNTLEMPEFKDSSPDHRHFKTDSRNSRKSSKDSAFTSRSPMITMTFPWQLSADVDEESMKDHMKSTDAQDHMNSTDSREKDHLKSTGSQDKDHMKSTESREKDHVKSTDSQEKDNRTSTDSQEKVSEPRDQTALPATAVNLRKSPKERRHTVPNDSQEPCYRAPKRSQTYEKVLMEANLVDLARELAGAADEDSHASRMQRKQSEELIERSDSLRKADPELVNQAARRVLDLSQESSEECSM